MNLASGQHGFHCNTARWVLTQEIVEDRITDGVSHFVWMALGNGLRSKQSLRHLPYPLIADGCPSIANFQSIC